MGRFYKFVETGRVVEVHGMDVGYVLYCNAGGGLQCAMDADRFRLMTTPLPDEYLTSSPWKPGEFGIEDWMGPFPGYSQGRRWNGWACPVFPLESAHKIVEHCNREAEKHGGELSRYDAQADVFLIWNEGQDEPDVFMGDDIVVDGKVVRVYHVGTGSWTWEEAEEPGQEPEQDD